MNGQEEEAAVEDVSQDQPRRTRKSYTTLFKLEVVRAAKLTTQRKAAARFGVDRKQVRAWISSEDQLLGCPRKRRRLDGAGCKPADEVLEKS